MAELVSIVLEFASFFEQDIRQEVRLLTGVTKDVEKLFFTFRKIHAVLKDAEQKINIEAVRLWLEDLKDVASDADDLLDEWKTKLLLRSHKERLAHAGFSLKKKVRTTLFSPYFYFKRVALHHNIGIRIKDIKKRLEEIATEKNSYDLIESSSGDRRVEDQMKIEITSSLVDESEIFGRDQEKDFIISKLVTESSQQAIGTSLPIISIVGMGGLGKTTIAQLAFNDGRVVGHFQNRVWVCVSDPFDIVGIAKKIIKDIGDVNVVDGDGSRWDSLHPQLSDSIEGKHFLLVLDDVWTEDHAKWDPLMLSLNRGAQGSRILVTTRNERVAIMMGATCIHKLGTLSNEDCWSIMSRKAFVGRGEECADFKAIGMEIAEKCKGLPLSAKAIGGLLRFKKTKHEWQHVLKSDIWKIENVETTILPALLLSYYDLPSHLKQCFAFCAIFPKDCVLYKELTIEMWMAQGFLNRNSITENKELEMIGEEYFNNLAMRSFFQDFEMLECDGTILSFMMHDLVHDLAQFLTKSECFIMGANHNDQGLNYSRARHLNLVFENKEMYNFLPFICKAKKLHTLIVNGHISSSVSLDLFHHLTCVRVLSLSKTELEVLPSDVGRLIHLRYLNLSHTRLKTLPKTVSNLYNLQTLSLQGCKSLCKLPNGILAMVNLRHLELYESRQLSCLPQGIGRLSSLRRLSDFIVSGGNVDGEGCTIGELRNLNLLQGDLRIQGLWRVKNGNEAKEAELKNKEHLRRLCLYFYKYRGVAWIADNVDWSVVDESDVGVDSDKNINDINCDNYDVDDNDNDTNDDDDDREHISKRTEDVLESLQPHPNLEILEIHDYLGIKFPNWMVRDNGSMLLSNVMYLDLCRWRKCRQLPPALGKLPSLKKLCIRGMDKVKNMGLEFFGINGVDDIRRAGEVKMVFPKLSVLQISNMLNLQKWHLTVPDDGTKIIIMPYLYHLVMSACPKLELLPHQLLRSTSLTKLVIAHCPKLTWTAVSRISSLPQLKYLEQLKYLGLWGNASVFSKSLSPNSSHTCFPNLKFLTIRRAPYQSLPEGLGQLTTLQSLNIRASCSIAYMPQELQHLSTLQNLIIYQCCFLGPRCQKEGGEDWCKISHISNIEIDGKKIQ